MKLLPLALLVLALPTLASTTKQDVDKDGISDIMDKCPRTPGNSTVNSYGCMKGEKVVLSVDVNFQAIKRMLVDDYRSLAGRLTAVGIGETDRVTPHQGVEGNYRNRRVEARIIE